MKRVLVAEALDEEGIGLLKPHFLVDTRELTSEDELKDIVHQYDGLMIKTYTRVSRDVIDRATKLKIIARAGTGLDKVDIEYAQSKGIAVRNTPEANTVSVAEMVIALMLSVARKVVLADRYVRNRGGWDRDRFLGTELAEKTIGIVGLGHIGRLVAARARGFEMQGVGFDPFIDREEMARSGVDKIDSLQNLLEVSDFVSVHVPLMGSTRHLIGEKEFDAMKRTAILINTSRGPVVDQSALVAALRSGKISGAGLDVFEVEPPEDMELLKLKNIVVSPHIGAATHEALRKMTVHAAQIVIEQLSQ